MREHIYTTIEHTFNRHKALFAEYELKPINQIDLFYGQYQLTQKFETFLTPALFLEISCEYSQNPRRANGIATIITHLVLESNQATDSIKKKGFRDKLFTYHNAMRKAMEQSHSQHFRTPLLIAQEPIETITNLIVIKDTYQTAFNDPFEYNQQPMATIGNVEINKS